MGTAVPEQHPAVHKLNIGHLERANLISGTRTACQGGLAAGLAVTLDVCQLDYWVGIWFRVRVGSLG